MSAPQIPNLNTLRRGGGRGRLRGRGGFAGDGGGGSAASRGGKDRVVQGTDHDASVSRLSAVGLGYLEDPFARALTPPDLETRRLPIINRGTYVRTTAIDQLVHRFLTQPSAPHRPQNKKQIISLGAGSDTRVFRLLPSHPDLIYHEIDFAVNTAAKIRFIRAAPHLQRALGIIGQSTQERGKVEISDRGDALHTEKYHLHPLDLRNLKPKTKSNPTVPGGGSSNDQDKDQDKDSEDPRTYLRDVDPTLPTLLISECCLIYLSPREAADVVDFFTQTLFPGATTNRSGSNGAGVAPLGLILYEPIRPHDAFGRTMVSNLATRGIQLQTLHQYATLGSQRQRLRDQGFVDGQAAADVHFIWDRWVSEAEKERVAALEMLDEMEEWNLLAQHYCIAWGWREGLAAGFEGWKDFDSQQGVES
ncbi:leucine carboxyl methyltransferase [Aspergillus steynii IBT 23096]|uniref:Leucine carboxyl methyltransferase 1 n=1 Tax=Aspergillus steynii IBT 23096 TaxID=1392250 RepID=A0A2I2GHD0_9EURO|nr:leucine carboxyl methyltransferase [Aspergillus steynii IBT 23096]PLB52286.1 leucine carboxyl methyltransferase [Aspergillus steynii IBT 23096]